MAPALTATTVRVQDLQLTHYQLIDVRTAAEFATGHIPTAINIPMAEIENRLGDLHPDKPILLICQTDKRSALTRAILQGRSQTLHQDIAILEGGTAAWQLSGQPLITTAAPTTVPSRWPIESQVRLIAGLIALSGVLLGYFVNRNWFLLAGFVALGLTLSGATNYCALAKLLAHLPWNNGSWKKSGWGKCSLTKRNTTSCGSCTQ